MKFEGLLSSSFILHPSSFNPYSLLPGIYPMSELRMLTVGGDRPIQVPAGVRMAYIDQLGRENVVFVPNILKTAPMGEWEEQDLPVLTLSTQTRTLWSGAPIEWRPKEEQVVRLLTAGEAQERLRPLTLTVADLMEWAYISRDPALPMQLIRVALKVMAWLGRPAMTPQQHAEWTRRMQEPGVER
jgi:hypothetical protein